MILKGIQSKDLCKIRSGAGDKKTLGIDAENKLNEVYGSKYRIRLDHQILTNHGVFYPQALYNDLTFDVKLAEAIHVVRGSNTTQLKYKLTNIQLEYEIIRSKTLADEAHSIYSSGKEFTYDHVMHDKEVSFKKGTDTRINIKVNTQRRSLKALLLVFVEPYTVGDRDSEKFIFPDLTKLSVTVNGSPNMFFNDGIEGKDMWEEAHRFFVKEKNKTKHMNMTKFYTDDKFGLVIDMRSTADQSMHGSGKRIVNSTDGVQLEIERKAEGSGDMKSPTPSSTLWTDSLNLYSFKYYMDPSKIPFNALIVGPTNSGKSRFVVDQIYGPFHFKFDYIVLICLTFAHNKTYHRIGENDPRMNVIVCEQHDLEKWLKLVRRLFEDTNTLVILDDCTASKDVKGRTGGLVNVAFSARHMGISVWVLTQKMTGITASFRENVGAIVLFYTPSAKTMKAILMITLVSKLKERKFSRVLASPPLRGKVILNKKMKVEYIALNNG